jgi:Rieske 2Fe-2S family protein
MTGQRRRKLVGIWGRPFIDLSPFIDTSCFPELDAEICRALAVLETGQTGATLKWMGVVAPWAMDDGYLDAMHVLEGLSRDELSDFVALGENPEAIELDGPRAFGDETDHPFTVAQMRWLSFRHGVYFPWKVCFHLLENDRWEDKHSGTGKAFAAQAEEHLPETVAFVKRLPFREIGRAVLFGIEPNDHAPAHRDTEPGVALAVPQCINFDPRGGKGLYLRDPDGGSHTPVDAPIYWFNDMDYHGVLAAPRFRYSLRIDGVFEPAFLKRLEAAHARPR